MKERIGSAIGWGLIILWFPFGMLLGLLLLLCGQRKALRSIEPPHRRR